MDLSAFLDLLNSNVPEESKNFIFQNILDENSYEQLMTWQQRQNSSPGQLNRNESSHQRNNHRQRHFRRTEEEMVIESAFRRSFVVPSGCKGIIIGRSRANIENLKKMGVTVDVSHINEREIEVSLFGDDKEILTGILLEIWDKIGIRQSKERSLTGEQKEIVLGFSDEKRANFIIHTGCNVFINNTRKGTEVKLKAWNPKEADAAVAQILVDMKDSWSDDEDSEAGHEDDGGDEKSNAFPPMNILLIGMEGVGKTLFINSLANYLKFNRFDEARMGELKAIAKGNYMVYDEEKKSHQIELIPTDDDDLTEMPIVHSFNGVVKSEPREIRVIDTLGIPPSGVSDCLEHFKSSVVEEMKKLGEIHAVVLMLSASEDRLSKNFSTVIKSFFRVFHRDLLRNVLFCFTRSGPNFNQELSHESVRKFTEQMQKEEDMLIHFNRESSFCFDNSGFVEVIAEKQGISVNLEKTTEFWEKSAEQAIRFLEKISELPIFDASRVVPPFPENLIQMKIENLPEKMEETAFLHRKRFEESMAEKNNASLELLESDLEREIVSKLLSIPGEESERLLKKIVGSDNWEMFYHFREHKLHPVDENQGNSKENGALPSKDDEKNEAKRIEELSIDTLSHKEGSSFYTELEGKDSFLSHSSSVSNQKPSSSGDEQREESAEKGRKIPTDQNTTKREAKEQNKDSSSYCVLS